MRFIGIDVGIKGGFAVLDEWGIQAFPLPFKKKELDINALSFFLLGEDCFAAIEAVHAMPGQGVCSMFTFGKGYGELLGMLKTLSTPFVNPSPQAWMKHVFIGMDWKGKKKFSVNYVEVNYPKVNLKPGKKRVPHDGMADAICLAEYAKRIYLTKNS